jgi:hypothetical protein
MLFITLEGIRAQGAIQRPLSDFLNTQGSVINFVPPVPDYLGWSTSFNEPDVRFALIDYAGIAAKWIEDNAGLSLGTSINGSVSERRLSDGRAEITILLHTKNALIWAMSIDPANCCDFVNTPLLFGYRAQDLVANPTLQPALAECQFQFVFKNSAPGAPIPDLVDAFIFGNTAPGQELVSYSLKANGDGPLRAEFGVPDGTRGRIIVTQIGLLFRGLSSPDQWRGARSDGFPVEKIELRVQ